MRALHVIGSVAAREGGPSAALRGMTAALAARGVEVTVATTDADGSGRLAVPLDTEVMEGTVGYRYFARSLPGRYKFSLSLARWLDANVSRFDVVHVHGLWDWASVAGCRTAGRHHVPYVMRTLGMLDPWCLSRRRWKKAPYYHTVERTHLRGAAAIMATSEMEAEGVAAFGFGARTHVIPLGVSVPEWISGARRHSADGPVRLVFLSRVHPGKGLELLTDAMAAVRQAGVDAVLDVIGSGDGEYVRDLRARVSGLGLDDRVRFHGHLDGAEKWRALAETDVFVLPSSHENFGVAVAEALCAGLPVVISDQVAIAPEVRGAGAGLVVPLDAGRLAAALAEIACDAGRREAMGERARTLAQQRYSWVECARRVAELYEELVEAGAGVPYRAARAG